MRAVNRRGILTRRWSSATVAVAVLLASAKLVGDTTQPIEYLRIGVPAARLGDLSVKGFPRDRETFEKRIQDLNAKHRALTDPVGTRIVSAVYAARLDGVRLVAGSAELRIKHALPEPGYVALEPLGLAIRALRWRDDENNSLRAGRVAGGAFSAYVDRDNTLEFDWSLRGQHNRDNILQFSFALPNAAVNELQIDVPETQRPRCSVGIASMMPQAAETPQSEPLPEGYRRWRIELGTRATATVELVAAGETDIDRRLVIARTATSYSLDASGLDLESTYHLAAHGPAISQLTLDADPGLRVGSVTLNGETVRITEALPQHGRGRQYQLALPQAVSGEAELVVRSFAAAVFDQPWELPATRILDIEWTDGTLRLQTVDEVLVRRVRGIKSVLRRAEPLPAPRNGSARDYELLAPTGSIEVLLRRPVQQWACKTYTAIRLGETTVTARVSAVMASRGQAGLSFPIRRRPGWSIDSIETQPSDWLQQQIVRGPGGQMREIRLSRPATAAATVRVVIRARRNIGAATQLRGDNLRPVAFSTAFRESSLVAVAAAEPLQLVTSDDAAIDRVDDSSLSAEDRELLAAEENSLIYRDGPSADVVQFATDSTPPRFTARASISVVANADKFEAEYLLQCHPIASRVSRLRVRFSEPHLGAINWSVSGDRAGSVRATLVDRETQTWDIQLARPREVTFNVRATVTAPLIDAFAIPLVSVPEADTQVGTLSIGTHDGTQLAIERRGLKAIAGDDLRVEAQGQTQGVYRYTPSENAFAGVTEVRRNQARKAWVRSAKVTSRFDVGGRLSHDLRLRVENLGTETLKLTLPADALARSVTIGKREVAWPTTVDTLSVPLPQDKASFFVRVRYEQQVQDGMLLTAVRPLLPTLEVPCLDWTWDVWLPPGYRAMPDTRIVLGSQLQDQTWDTRLFGYSLFRRSGRPWSVSDTGILSVLNANNDSSDRLDFANVVRGSMRATLSNRSASPDEALTWGAVVRDVIEVADDPCPLWIDAPRLRAAGLSVNSRLPVDRNASLSPESLLRRSGLLLVVDQQGVILTTVDAHSQGAFGESRHTKDRLLIADGFVNQTGHQQARDWLTTAVTPDPDLSLVEGRPITPLIGWSNLQLQLDPNIKTPLTFYRERVLSGMGWAAFFLMLAAVIWLGARKPSTVYLLLIATVVLTLFVPPYLTVVARATFLATIAGVWLLLLQTTSLRSSSRRQDDSISIRLSESRVVATGLLLLAALIAFACATHSIAQDVSKDGEAKEPVPMDERSTPALFSIYYAMDEERKPIGDTYWVPKDFLDALDQLESELTGTRAAWLLEACNYSVELESGPNGIELGTLSLDCEVTTDSERDTRITLPFSSKDVIVEATLDGGRVFPVWSDDGESVGLDVRGDRRYRLRLNLRPLARPDGNRPGFDIRVPSLPTSRLTVRGPNLGEIEVPHRLGAMLPEMNSQRLAIELGSTNRLTVNWPGEMTNQSTAPMLSIDQRIWLRPTSGLVNVDALFSFTVVSGRLRQIELQTDPRLKALPLAESEPIERVSTKHGERNEITVVLDRTYVVGDTLAFKASFVLPLEATDTKLSGPLVALRGVTPKASTLGLSSRPGIFAELEADAATPADPDEFASGWGTMRSPDEVLQLGPEPSWTLSLARPKPRVSVSEQTDLVINRGTADVEFRAALDIADQTILQIELQTPPELNVESIEVVQEDVDIVRRWMSDGAGTTTVQLSRAMEGAARLVMSGSVETQPNAQFKFSGVRTSNAERTNGTTRIYRHPQVLVTLGLHEHYELQTSNKSLPSGADRGRIVATLKETTTGAASITLGIKPNAARFTSTLVTTLRPGNPYWMVEAELSIKVATGVLDTVRLRLPRELATGVSLDASYSPTIEDVPGQAEVLLLVTPPNAIEQDLKLRLTAPLALLDGGRISAPNIEVLDAMQVSRSLVLPLKSGTDAIAWDTRGLERPVATDDNITYIVSSPRMRATIRDRAQVTGTPSVLLADYKVDWRKGGGYWGVADFDIVPGGQHACELEVPPGVRIIHLETAGLTSVTSAGADSDNIVRVTLGVEQLPQRLTVLFVGQSPAISAPRPGYYLQAPSIKDIKRVEKTYWTLHRADSYDSHQPLLAHAIRSAGQTRTARQEHVQHVLALGEQAASQHRLDDFTVWRTKWARRQKQNELGAARDEVSSELVRLEHRAARHMSGSGSDVHLAFEGPAPALTLIATNPSLPNRLQRPLAVMIVTLLVSLVFIARSWQTLWEFVATWPHLLGVIAGLTWWLWLSPSIIGWIIVVISLLSAARPTRYGRTVRAH